MTYTAPPTKTPPTPTLAADWNTYIRDNETTLRANALSGMGELIQSQAISAAASVTFSSLTTDYTHLGIVGHSLYADTADTDLLIRMNADSGANYGYAVVARTSAGVDASTDGTGATSILIADLFTIATSNTIFRGYIFNYREAVYKRLILTANGNSRIATAMGNWNSTAAITSLVFSFGGTNVVTGTFAVYGLND